MRQPLSIVYLLLCTACGESSARGLGDAGADWGETLGAPDVDPALHCIEPLECTTDCTYDPVLDVATYCAVGPGAGVKRTTCGAYRVQATSDGSSTRNDYYRIDDGRLVAQVRYADTDTYCGGRSLESLRGELDVIVACQEALDASDDLCTDP